MVSALMTAERRRQSQLISKKGLQYRKLSTDKILTLESIVVVRKVWKCVLAARRGRRQKSCAGFDQLGWELGGIDVRRSPEGRVENLAADTHGRKLKPFDLYHFVASLALPGLLREE
jgi:hypothetical protein